MNTIKKLMLQLERHRNKKLLLIKNSLGSVGNSPEIICISQLGYRLP